MREAAGLGLVDCLVLGCSLMLSVGTGVYHMIKSRALLSRETKRSSLEEYQLGGREMPALPVALSLLTTFLSGILMLGVPAEVAHRGLQIWLNFAIGAVAFVLTALVFLPVFHKMKATSLHEYFILRYGSWTIRRAYSALFCCYTIIYMSIVIYAPCVALAGVVQIDKSWLIVILGTVATLYTTIGGLKAVVWTDSLQAVLMYGGVLVLIGFGLAHERVGGIQRVWQLSWETGRIQELAQMDVTPAQYNSLWINLLAGTVTWLSGFGVNQLAMQRYASLPTLDRAKKIIYATAIPFVVLCSCVVLIGMILFAYFYGCDPFESGRVTHDDQLTVLFAHDILSPHPGLFGLYLSCVMSATLSTLSSGMSSMATVLYEDFLTGSVAHRHAGDTTARATLINKILVLICGLFSTVLAFAAEPLGGILKACMSALGTLSGPFVAIFVLGLFFPNVGRRAVMSSFVGSTIVMVCIFLWGYLVDPYKELHLPTYSDAATCLAYNDNSTFTPRTHPAYDAHFGDPDSYWIARLSVYAYPGIGFVLMLVWAQLYSLLVKEPKIEGIEHLTYAGRRLPMPTSPSEAHLCRHTLLRNGFTDKNGNDA